MINDHLKQVTKEKYVNLGRNEKAIACEVIASVSKYDE